MSKHVIKAAAGNRNFLAPTAVFWDIENISRAYELQIANFLKGRVYSIFSAVQKSFRGSKVTRFLDRVNANYDFVDPKPDAADLFLCSKLREIVGNKNFSYVKEVVLISDDRKLIKSFNKCLGGYGVTLTVVYKNRSDNNNGPKADNSLLLWDVKSDRGGFGSLPRKIPPAMEEIETPYNKVLSKEQKQSFVEGFNKVRAYLPNGFLRDFREKESFKKSYTEMFVVQYLISVQVGVKTTKYARSVDDGHPLLKTEKNDIFVEVVHDDSSLLGLNSLEKKEQFFSVLAKNVRRVNETKIRGYVQKSNRFMLAFNYAEFEGYFDTYESFKKALCEYISVPRPSKRRNENSAVSGILVFDERVYGIKGRKMEIIYNEKSLLLPRAMFKGSFMQVA